MSDPTITVKRLTGEGPDVLVSEHAIDITRALDAGSSSAQVAQLRLLGEIANALWTIADELRWRNAYDLTQVK